MNFLAHFHLSGDNESIAIGNFLGDFIRGSELKNLPEEYRKGVQLHRFIDRFTDDFHGVREINQIIQPYFAKYAPVVSDVYFDYFLASNFSAYSTVSLREYTRHIYALMERNLHVFPDRASRFYYFMIERDIFFEYGNKNGLQHVFNGLSHRASFDSHMEKGVEVLTQFEDKFQSIFDVFYPELQVASTEYLNKIM